MVGLLGVSDFWFWVVDGWVTLLYGCWLSGWLEGFGWWLRGRSCIIYVIRVAFGWL